MSRANLDIPFDRLVTRNGITRLALFIREINAPNLYTGNFRGKAIKSKVAQSESGYFSVRGNPVRALSRDRPGATTVLAECRSRDDTSIPTAKRLRDGHRSLFLPRSPLFPARSATGPGVFRHVCRDAHRARGIQRGIVGRNGRTVLTAAVGRVTDMILPEIGTRFPVRSTRA